MDTVSSCGLYIGLQCLRLSKIEVRSVSLIEWKAVTMIWNKEAIFKENLL